MKTVQVFAILLVLGFPGLEVISLDTDTHDAVVLQSLKQQWKNTPPSWDKSEDPCKQWEGVTCVNSRVTDLRLSGMGLEGTLSGDIADLSELTTLVLSYNKGFTGSLSPQIGKLKKLTILILAGCGFTGSIPKEIGNLADLRFLALNSNKFSGTIPPTLGSLSNLYWLDLADNLLTGTLPVSTDTTPGLDQLLKAKHFHLNKNQLTGSISPKLFSSGMELIHILLDGNQLTGKIPPTLGLIQTLEVLRLDRNALSGPVPSNLNNLTSLKNLHLAYNQLNGPVPDLAGINSLYYVDLSNNKFDPSEAPTWFSTVQLTTLVMENGNLQGLVPENLFSFPQLQQVKLKANFFNGTLDMGNSFSEQLQLVDLQNNNISSFTLRYGYRNDLILIGNPVCSLGTIPQYCQHSHENKQSYSTGLGNCDQNSCPSGQKVFPQGCCCTYPYTGTLYFRAPYFSDVSNASVFHSLEMSLIEKLQLSPGSVILQNPFFNNDNYLQITLELFPSSGKYFNRSEIQRIGFDLSNQTYKPPTVFGPYYFIPSPYIFEVESGRVSMSIAAIIGLALGSIFLILVVIGVGIYAFRQKKRAERAIDSSKPFASWVPSNKDSGGAPQLKGARWFSFEELRKCTNNFLESNLIGSGGYGKVYRGILPTGQLIAIKRAKNGSMQGGLEFKTEIELLSRVHHKNLVSLVGFCFEQGEQILVYEFMPNGTLNDHLMKGSGIHLDWKRRLRITLGSARGLAYLHELANPPIIHRDVKSTNILLDENLTAKVADFGLSKLVSDSENGHVSTQVKGTLGYMDPEYYMTQHLTEKSDVYSFGVVMFELITARLPIENGKYIVREVTRIMDMNDEKHCGLKDIMDPMLRNETHLVGFKRFLQLAIQCVQESASNRPSMSDVVKAIETILQDAGLNTDSTTASSSAIDTGIETGTPSHPYHDSLLDKNAYSSDSFHYSGGYAPSTTVEPK